MKRYCGLLADTLPVWAILIMCLEMPRKDIISFIIKFIKDIYNVRSDWLKERSLTEYKALSV